MLVAAMSSLLLQHTARIYIFILFCMWPYNRICCPWLLFSYSAVFTMPKLVMDFSVPPRFEHRWVLQATSAVAQLPPRIFCYFATAEAVGEETLLKIPVPKPTPMQLLSPLHSWRGDAGFSRRSLSIAISTSSASRLQCKMGYGSVGNPGTARCDGCVYRILTKDGKPSAIIRDSIDQ